MPLIVSPFKKPLYGKISVPGSKSLTNRIFPLAVLAGEKVEIHGALESEDSEIMRNALQKMGVEIAEIGKNSWSIHSKNFFTDMSNHEIFCGNSGTTIRFLAALCVLRKGNTVLTGIDRMKQRPIGDLVLALRQMGAHVEFLENDGFPPLKIFAEKTPLLGTEYGGKEKMDILKKVSLSGKLSSQFFTALFHVAPRIGMEISVEHEMVSKPYIDMSISLMQQFGVEISNKNYEKFSIPSQKFSAPNEILVEGDASSASYPLAIAAITGGDCVVENIPKNSLQGDSRFQELVIEKMVDKTGKSLKALGEVNLEDIPDVAMTAVVLCAYADGYSKITGLSTLRHKECDRIFALESNLKKMGATVSSGEDYMEIWGNAEKLHGADIECFNDHRVAMCFAVLGTVIPGVNILDPDCTKKTYPTFWNDLDRWRNL